MSKESACSCVELIDGKKLYFIVKQKDDIWKFTFTNFQEVWTGDGEFNNCSVLLKPSGFKYSVGAFFLLRNKLNNAMKCPDSSW